MVLQLLLPPQVKRSPLPRRLFSEAFEALMLRLLLRLLLQPLKQSPLPRRHLEDSGLMV